MNFISYDKSPAPPNRSPGPRAKPAIAYNESPKPGAQRAFVKYDATPPRGLNEETVVLPLRPNRATVGAHFTEKEESIKLLHVGEHVVQQVSDALRVSDDEGRKSLHWYVGSLRGASGARQGGDGQAGNIRHQIRQHQQSSGSAEGSDRAIPNWLDSQDAGRGNMSQRTRRSGSLSPDGAS